MGTFQPWAVRHGLATVHPSVPVDARVLVQKESWKGRGGAWRSASSPRAPLRHDHMAPSYATGAPCFVPRRRSLRFEQPRVAAPWGPCPKVWPPCSFSNKEPSKTSVWLPCSGHVQEQKRLPPRLANDSNRGLQGRRLLWGFMLRACLSGVRARVHAGSCREANMTLSDCLCHACLCCMRARVCAESGHGAPGRRIRSLWV